LDSGSRSGESRTASNTLIAGGKTVDAIAHGLVGTIAAGWDRVDRGMGFQAGLSKDGHPMQSLLRGRGGLLCAFYGHGQSGGFFGGGRLKRPTLRAPAQNRHFPLSGRESKGARGSLHLSQARRKKTNGSPRSRGMTIAEVQSLSTLGSFPFSLLPTNSHFPSPPTPVISREGGNPSGLAAPTSACSSQKKKNRMDPRGFRRHCLSAN